MTAGCHCQKVPELIGTIVILFVAIALAVCNSTVHFPFRLLAVLVTDSVSMLGVGFSVRASQIDW